MAGSDRETGLIASVTDRRYAVALGWLSLVTLVVLSGCTTGADVAASPTTAGDPAADAAVTSSPTASPEPTASPTADSPTTTATTESSSTTGDSTATSTAVPTDTPTETDTMTPTETDTVTQTETDTVTPTATETPDENERGQQAWADEFVDRLESAGIEVVDLELADDQWMLTYRVDETAWADNADEIQTIAETYCGLFDDGLAVGPDGSDRLSSDALDADGDFRYVTGVDPRWCLNVEAGASPGTADEFMVTVLNTFETGERADQTDPLETGDRYLSAETAARRFVEDVESQGITVEAMEADDDGDWTLRYETTASSWGEHAGELEIIAYAYCDVFDEGLEVGENGSAILFTDGRDADGSPQLSFDMRPHVCDDGNDLLMQRAFRSLTV